MVRKICCLGDSITWTATSRSVHPYPLYLEMGLGAGYIVGNQAVSGYTISQIQSLYTSYVAGEGYDDVILLGGINDLRTGASDLATYATWKAIVDAVLAEGSRLVGFNVLQMKAYPGWDQSREDNRTLFNASVEGYLTNPLTVGYSQITFIDAAADFADGVDPAVMKAAYNVGDDLHPNQAGTQRLASLAQAAILATG